MISAMTDSRKYLGTAHRRTENLYVGRRKAAAARSLPVQWDSQPSRKENETGLPMRHPALSRLVLRNEKPTCSKLSLLDVVREAMRRSRGNLVFAQMSAVG